jgi:hypothetical protein
MMAEERSRDLERRRDELTRSLPGLSEKRANTYRLNSDALALDRAGVKHQATVRRARADR